MLRMAHVDNTFEAQVCGAQSVGLFFAVAAFWTSPYLVESHLLFPVIDPICQFELCRTDIAKARMPSARIVEPFDVLSNCLASLAACRECGPPDEFGLDGLEDRLDHGVVIAVATPAH